MYIYVNYALSLVSPNIMFRNGFVSSIQLNTNTHNEEAPILMQSLKYTLNTQLMYPLPTRLYTPMILTVCSTRSNEQLSATSLLKKKLMVQYRQHQMRMIHRFDFTHNANSRFATKLTQPHATWKSVYIYISIVLCHKNKI